MTTATTARLRIIVAALGLVAAALLSPTLVLGHSELDVPTPADGATVEGTPDTIEGTFTEAMDPEGSSLDLRDATGTSVATGGVDPDDDLRMAIDPVPELAPGTYEVQWQAIAIDGHIERGVWSFTVAAAPTAEPTPEPTPTPEPSATAAPTDTPEPTAAPTDTPAPSPAASPDPDDGDGAGADVILPIVLGLTIVAIAAAVLIGRRGRTPAE